MASVDQTGAFDGGAFTAGLENSLSQGRFRLVIVLDVAPEACIQFVGYLGVVSEKLLIDMITVASYDVGGPSWSRSGSTRNVARNPRRRFTSRGAPRGG
jgi:hypothetical protein